VQPLLELLERPARAVVRNPVVASGVDAAGLSQVELRHAARPVREQLVRDRIKVGSPEPCTAQEPAAMGAGLRRDPGRARRAVRRPRSPPLLDLGDAQRRRDMTVDRDDGRRFYDGGFIGYFKPNPPGRVPLGVPSPHARRRFAGMFEAGYAYRSSFRRAIVAAVMSAAPFTKYTKRADETADPLRLAEEAALELRTLDLAAEDSGGLLARLKSINWRDETGMIRLGRAPEYYGGKLTQDQALSAAERWLGPGYREVSPGRFVSADGNRIVRYGAHETRSAVEHIHFEGAENGFVVENTWAEVVP
jgi:hypothetical protein